MTKKEIYNLTLILDDKQWHSYSSLLFSSLIYYGSTWTQNCKLHNLYGTFTSFLNTSPICIAQSKLIYLLFLAYTTDVEDLNKCIYFVL